ncbi:hypothetical protein [Mesorhizobium sp. M0478]|uniref:hypothetical protein n=1 Tax=Mesorhizobium sp. M0478 TaxID=2956947 RepID=UPI0033399E1A
MTTTKEMVLIGGVVKALRDRGSWTGETHVQKATFIAKVAKHVPFESEFVLYKHGPFSFDLSKSIVHMRSRGLLVTEVNPGYGPSFNIKEILWRALDRTASNIFAQYEVSILQICEILAPKSVSELERIATAIYVSELLPNSSKEEKIKELVRLKPHILPDLASRAFEEAGLFL